MRWLLLLVIISCGGKGERKGVKTPQATPTPTNDPTSSDSKEIKKLKAQLAEMNSKSNASADSDGWLIPNEINFNNKVSIRVDFDDDDLGKHMRLTLTECGGVKILSEPTEIRSIDDRSTAYNTAFGKVGGLVNFFLYRANGEVTAPSSPCKLTADILDLGDESYLNTDDLDDYGVEDTKTKTITIKAGTARLSQLQNDDGTDKPYFATSNGRATLSVMTHGISDRVTILVFNEQGGASNSYQLIGKAKVLDLPSDGLFEAELCETPYLTNEEDGSISCRDDSNSERWITTVPTRNHLLIARSSEGDKKILLETGE